MSRTAIPNTITQFREEKFQTAYDFLFNGLRLDIKNLDFIHFLLGEVVCINGDRDCIDLLTNRICVQSLLPIKHGGLESRVILVDAGNCSDPNQCATFARQYGLDLKYVMNNIMVSRVFTIYQLVNVIIKELSKIIKRFSANVVVISNLLSLFAHDLMLQTKEYNFLIGQIINAVRKLNQNNDDCLIVVSINTDDINGSLHDYHLFTIFDKWIDIRRKKIKDKFDCRILTRNGNIDKFSLNIKDLLSISRGELY